MPSAARPEPTFANAILDSLPAAIGEIQRNGGVARACPAEAGRRAGRSRRARRLRVHFPVEGLPVRSSSARRRRRASRPPPSARDGMTAPGILLGDSVSPGETVVQANGSALAYPGSYPVPARARATPACAVACSARSAGACVILPNTRVPMAASRPSSSAWRTGCCRRPGALGSRRLELTHDALAEILGVRRPSVTTSGTDALGGKHLIRSTRRAVVIW